jgi:ligand-binding SRPBCC domain-containing protein
MNTKKWSQFLPVSMDRAWAFFSRPENLKLITPPDLRLTLTSSLTDMYEGMWIQYTVSPMLQIPLHWTTEITHIKNHHYFIDEQRTGPYKIWHHEHHFKQVSEGVEMIDILHYDIGMGIIGKLADKWMISDRIDHIFEYRSTVLKSMFA